MEARKTQDESDKEMSIINLQKNVEQHHIKCCLKLARQNVNKQFHFVISCFITLLLC